MGNSVGTSHQIVIFPTFGVTQSDMLSWKYEKLICAILCFHALYIDNELHKRLHTDISVEFMGFSPVISQSYKKVGKYPKVLKIEDT